MVPEILIFLIDGNPTVSIDQVLVVVAAAVVASAAAVTDQDVVCGYSGVTIYQKYQYLWTHSSYVICSYVFGITRASRLHDCSH